jgi:hypothetical protein
VKTIEIEAKTLMQHFSYPVLMPSCSGATSETLIDSLEMFVGLRPDRNRACRASGRPRWEAAVSVKEQAVCMRDTVLPAMDGHSHSIVVAI